MQKKINKILTLSLKNETKKKIAQYRNAKA